MSIHVSITSLRDNSWPVQARITKFGPKMQNTLVQLTLIFKVKFHLKVKFYPILSFEFVRVITHHPFKPRSPNLDQRWKKNFFKDRAHLSTFKIFIFDKFSCFIVLVVFLVIVQSSELVSVWFCEKMTFFPNFFSYHIFALYVGGASLGLPTACRLIAVSGARLPSVDGLVVRCIKMQHHIKSAITICLQFI